MAKIIFRPVCDACGEVLYCDVNFTESLLEVPVNNKEPCMTKLIEIEPAYCPHCGKTFEKILLPTRLPYHTNIMDDYD